MKMMNVMLAAMTASLLGFAAAPAQAQPVRGKDGSTWWKCADEGGECRFSGKRKVAYGANGRYAYRVFNNGTACNPGTFGGDPAVGVNKSCYYMSETPSRPLAAIDSNWRHCAGEDGFCKFQGERRVAYGAKDRWSYRIARDGVKCSPARFGDPYVGVVKSCYLDPYY